LASFGKDRYKLVQDKPPVADWHCPSLFNVHIGQAHGFSRRLIVRELDIGFRIFPHSLVQVLNDIGRIDDLPDLLGKIKIGGEILPIFPTGFNSMPLFVSPFSCQGFQGSPGGCSLGHPIDLFEIGTARRVSIKHGLSLNGIPVFSSVRPA
jgi:hypothetical protein